MRADSGAARVAADERAAFERIGETPSIWRFFWKDSGGGALGGRCILGVGVGKHCDLGNSFTCGEKKDTPATLEPGIECEEDERVAGADEKERVALLALLGLF